MPLLLYKLEEELTMKTDFEKFEKGQVFLLNNGTFAYIADVDPITKLNKDDRSRMVSCRLGEFYKKSEHFKKGYSISLEDGRSGMLITIDVSKIKNISIEELDKMEVRYVGKLNQEKQKLMNKLSQDYANDQEW